MGVRKKWEELYLIHLTTNFFKIFFWRIKTFCYIYSNISLICYLRNLVYCQYWLVIFKTHLLFIIFLRNAIKQPVYSDSCFSSFSLSMTMITLLSSTLSPILLRSSLQWGGKYFSQWVWSANSLISSSFRPRDLMICHWYFIPPVFACSLLCKDQSQICITE